MEAIERESSAVGAPRCASCGGVIGVYEPLVHVVDGIARTSSRAADPHLARAPAGICHHVDCYGVNAAKAVAAA